MTVLGEEPDGQFAHPAEPTAENLAGVLPAVTEAGADVGFCQDPDADRLAVIDQSGRYLGEEYTLAMCVDHVLRQRKGPIVANCASSRMSRGPGRAIRRAATSARRWARRTWPTRCSPSEAIFGGEGNGGPIDPRVGYVRDSFVGMALLLDAMAARQMTIGQLADELPRYEIVKTKISLSAGKAARRPRCPGTAVFRRRGRPARRPAARLARPLAAWCAAATPSRSSERSPRPRRRPKRLRCAMPRRLQPLNRCAGRNDCY